MSGNGADLGAIYQAILAVAADVRVQGRKLDDLTGQVAGLRQAVDSYHGAVIGHGMLIGELDERVGRLEQHREPPEAA